MKKLKNITTMKATFRRKILQDQEESYDNFILTKDVKFCCEKFKAYCKKFTGWDYNKGKFIIINGITYEGNSTIEIDFCPFCGEMIEYENTN